MKTIGLALMVIIFLISCYRPSQKVIQGQCVGYDKGNHICFIDDETTPHKERIRVETEFATMGQEPVAGDWLRISYTEKDNTNKALKIMNLTAQKRLLLDVGIKLTDTGPQKIN
jgi:hypothetical protein